ncbi:hypothetical protein L228DRAFT_213211 [Xylona heveae TC161]|uniref:Concanavalin A-like lectin/glucanase n=1 Tax=Xylona heveae (strain CBS 132557 / TC161) TaxID=1328760 RepID=A0A165AIK5_XYLHT|nr:hypothetical protein L228DRAFT_213211 [Xylona heveae TC161]KZF20542.1 hypothetical protein L228DRAFT_213211 [Xylona heveae TC161]
MKAFEFSNSAQQVPSSLQQPFTITANPGTDLWRKPPSTSRFNVPFLHTRATPLASLQRARVRVSAYWKTLYDQGGLAIFSGYRIWIKAGIEFTHGRPNVSVVATDRWSDWSLSPMPQPNNGDVTIEMIREKDGSLWIYVIEADGEKRPVREVTWAFDSQDKAECWVGAFAAKPSNEAGNLEVQFDGLEIEFA